MNRMTRAFLVLGAIAYVGALVSAPLELSALRLPLFQVAASAFALSLVLGRIARRRAVA